MGGDPFLSMPVSKPKGAFAREIIAEPEGWTTDEAEEARFLDAEDLRLLYVAATRAENLLIVSTYAGNAERGPWVLLYPFLEDVPELPVYPFTSVLPENIGELNLNQQCKELSVFWQTARQESDTLHHATTDRPNFLIAPSNPSHGTAYGAVIHQLFDAAIHNRLPDEPTAYVRFLFAEHSADPAYVNHALKALTDFRTSDLWAEIQSATAFYTEVPFAISESGGILHGVIDLVYRLPNGWKIVDYKTDVVQTEEEVQALIQQATSQLTAYANQWTLFTGEQVVVKGLWLIERYVFKEV
jgi:ATP-dependent helicase/nuclease subunit A